VTAEVRAVPGMKHFRKGGEFMKEKYLEIIRKYEERFGRDMAAEVQQRADEARDRIWRDQEHVLQWLPMRKQTETLETLMQSTYGALAEEMERALEKG